ncbi:MAG: ArnT family glycosyltransferase [Ferruginibacter sp.]
MNYKNKTLLLILIATAIRCTIACSVELGNDEVYYRMYAQYLQWNYFDHPPIVGWLIRFTTVNLFLDSAFYIRLGAIISAAITTWFIFLCGKRLNNEYSGFLAAVMYTCSIYGSIISGTFILPDSPQMICWSAGLYLLIKISRYNHINRTKKRDLLLFGLVTGIGMLCKIHTVFLWFGLLLYIIQHNRQWLTEMVFYISGAVTIALFFPVIKWNINNHFITYLYHSKRVIITNSGFELTSFFTFIGGQVFYSNPIIFVLIIIATVAAFKNNLPVSVSQKRMLLYCSLPLIIVATGISLFKNTLPHWTGPAYSGFILLAACWLSGQKIKSLLKKRVMPKSLIAAIAFQLLVITGGILLINFIPGTLGKKEKIQLGEGDFTLDMYGWKNLRTQFKKIAESDLHTGLMKKNAFIICNKWFPASHLDYYVAMPLQKELLAIGDTNDIHQYAWINYERNKMNPGDDAYCIVPSNYNINPPELYAAFFTGILPPQIIVQKRNGKVCRRFYIWRMKSFIANQNPRIK